jgi:hypothetical protein
VSQQCAIVTLEGEVVLRSLPATIVYRGKQYRLSATNGKRRGLILTLPRDLEKPVAVEVKSAHHVR